MELSSLYALLKKHNIEAPVEFNTNKPTRNGSQWFIGKKWQLEGKDFAAATFGDFKQNLKESWDSTDKATVDQGESAEVKAKLEEMLRLEKIEKEKVFEEVSLELTKEFAQFASTGETPYTRRKQITGGLHGARIKQNENGDPILIVPLRDVEGRLWNYQRIYSQKLSHGDKFFAEGARIEGCFHVLEEHPQPDQTPETIHICEGFATAVSVKLSGACIGMVVAAFNANNLSSVALALKSKYPTARLTICADNDVYTVINGKQVNTGLLKARQTSGKTTAEIRFPVFSRPQKGLTDFNDLHVAEGLVEVKLQIEKQKYIVKPGDIAPLTLLYNPRGEPKPPPEKIVADYLLANVGEQLVKQNKSVWRYTGTHWVELDVNGIDKLKQLLSQAVDHSLGSRDLEAYFRTLLLHMNAVPQGVNLYQPNPFIANFSDKTLHLVQKGNTYDFVWTPHQREDFITTVLPFPAPVSEQPASQFDAMMDRLWAGHVEAAQIKRLVLQTMGSCLIQAFPLIAIFQGKPGSGKSTIIKLMVKLLNRQNVCSVGPTEMHGFHMENMIAKLVNYDTDIDTNRPINDTVVKKLIDRDPIKVNRKGISMVEAFVPAVHLFACNQLPKTLDGASKAYARRFKIIPTDNVIKDETIDFDRKLLETELSGIIWRAWMGLKDIVANQGKFVELRASQELVSEIEMGSDIIGQFIQEIEEEAVQDDNNLVTIDPKGQIPRANLWSVFVNWQKDSLTQKDWVGKHEFNKRMNSRGFRVHKNVIWVVQGLKIQAQNNSVS